MVEILYINWDVASKEKKEQLSQYLTDSATTHFTVENMSSSLLKHKQLEAFGPPTNGSYEGIKVKNRIL